MSEHCGCVDSGLHEDGCRLKYLAATRPEFRIEYGGMTFPPDDPNLTEEDRYALAHAFKRYYIDGVEVAEHQFRLRLAEAYGH